MLLQRLYLYFASYDSYVLTGPTRVEALRRALRGDFDHLTGGDPICGPVFGVLYALKHVADDLGITGVLGRMRTGKLGLFLT